MAADLLTWLWHATLASSIAVVLVLAARKTLRRRFGAQVAYSLWMLVPVAIGVSLIPAPVTTEIVAPIGPAVTLAPSAPVPIVTDLAPPIDLDFWLLGTWFAGVAMWTALLAHQQRRFLAELGTLDRYDADAWRAQNITSCPALIGAWRPRIVLPRDFEERYTSVERALILAHERAHVARADAALNLGVSMLRCVFWFNPLLHAAAARFRFDQELACDAAVISRFPEARRPYADAMLKTQLADIGLPVGCHWQSSHPLKERISMLKSHLPSPRRKRLGVALCAAFVASVAAMAWAEQPKRLASPMPGVGDISTELRIKIDGHSLDGWTFNGDGHERPIRGSSEASTFTMNVRPGHAFDIKLRNGSDAWELVATPEREPDGTLRLSADLSHNGAAVGHPVLLVKANEPAGIRIGDESADGGFKGFEARITMASSDADPVVLGAPGQHATYRSITRIPYPAAQAKAGIGGTVLVLAHIAVDGHVVSTGLKSGPGNGADVYPLVTAALQGVQGWTFNPAMKDGKPVPSDEIVPIVFIGAQPLNALKVDGELDPIEVTSTSPLQAADDYSGPSENIDFRRMHPPKYPLAAIKARQTGHIVLKVLVSSTGEPESAEVYEAQPAEAAQAFADSSIAAAMQWRFKPGMRDGAPVAGYVLVPFDYNITEDDDDRKAAAPPDKS